MSVVIETTIGDITVDLYLEERPRTCLNFLKLCKMKYYNFCLFHKIEKNFIAQSGDPSGTGRGGESVFRYLYGEQAQYFDSELKPRIKHKKLGTLSMVNNGNNMNGSQFFITLGEDLTYLDEHHSVFGEVAEGFDILVKLNDTICDTNNRPYQDIRITHTVILHDPYEDPSNLEIPPSSPIPTEEILASDYVRADEEIDDNKGRSIEEIEEEIKDKEAKARATILEMVGDIPDADVKPPENVLFVCKLNPVTTDEDLEIIFSRFGVIKSCEVIKDKKTGESLQYAFIEFEREEDCETAYFKMDNVLIDDRRIHVDFSQSVAKLKFDKNNRPIIDEKKPSHKRDNFVIKDNTRKTEKYDMIFDSDVEDVTQPITNYHKKIRSSKKHSPSPQKMQHTSSTSKKSSKHHDYNKSQSRYSSKHSRRSHSSSPYSSKSSHKNKSFSNYSPKYNRDSRSISPRSSNSNQQKKSKYSSKHDSSYHASYSSKSYDKKKSPSPKYYRDSSSPPHYSKLTHQKKSSPKYSSKSNRSTRHLSPHSSKDDRYNDKSLKKYDSSKLSKNQHKRHRTSSSPEYDRHRSHQSNKHRK